MHNNSVSLPEMQNLPASHTDNLIACKRKEQQQVAASKAKYWCWLLSRRQLKVSILQHENSNQQQSATQMLKASVLPQWGDANFVLRPQTKCIGAAADSSWAQL